MDDPSFGTLSVAILLLVFLSAYISGSETAMMRLNTFRLRHLANEGHTGAKIAAKLLERPDQLLSVILIGNNLVNFQQHLWRRRWRLVSLAISALPSRPWPAQSSS